MAISVTIVVVCMLIVFGFIVERMYRLLNRQAEYIMAKENERVYQVSKPSRPTKQDSKTAEKQRKQAELRRQYDAAMERGEIDEDTYNALKVAEVG